MQCSVCRVLGIRQCRASLLHKQHKQSRCTRLYLKSTPVRSLYAARYVLGLYAAATRRSSTVQRTTTLAVLRAERESHRRESRLPVQQQYIEHTCARVLRRCAAAHVCTHGLRRACLAYASAYMHGRSAAHVCTCVPHCVCLASAVGLSTAKANCSTRAHTPATAHVYGTRVHTCALEAALAQCLPKH